MRRFSECAFRRSPFRPMPFSSPTNFSARTCFLNPKLSCELSDHYILNCDYACFAEGLYYPGKKIETTARTWHRRVICRACTRLCLACVPVSIFLARVVYSHDGQLFKHNRQVFKRTGTLTIVTKTPRA